MASSAANGGDDRSCNGARIDLDQQAQVVQPPEAGIGRWMFLGIAQHLRRDRTELDEGHSDRQASQLEAQLGDEVAQRRFARRIRCHPGNVAALHQPVSLLRYRPAVAP